MNQRPIQIVPSEIAAHECHVEAGASRVIFIRLGIGLGRAEKQAYLTLPGAQRLRNLLIELIGPPEAGTECPGTKEQQDTEPDTPSPPDPRLH